MISETDQSSDATAKMVKIVINSLLWFMYDRMSCLTGDTIFKSVTDFYSDDEIVEAKSVLYNNYEGAGRLKGRQGEQKSLNNVKDIHKVLLEMTSDKEHEAPTIVTATSHFPSLDITNLDAWQLMQDVTSLRQTFIDFKREKEADTIAFTDLKLTVLELTALLKQKSNSTKHVESVAQPQPIVETNVPTYTQVLKHPPRNQDGERSSQAVAREVNPINTRSDKNEEFTKVVRRRRAPRIGKLNGSDLKVVVKPVNIFTSRFDPDVTEREIENFVKNQFKEANSIKTEKLKTRYDTYSSFKISITGIPAKDCFKLDNWPTGILVKRFSSFSKTKDTMVPSKADNSNGGTK